MTSEDDNSEAAKPEHSETDLRAARAIYVISAEFSAACEAGKNPDETMTALVGSHLTDDPDVDAIVIEYVTSTLMLLGANEGGPA